MSDIYVTRIKVTTCLVCFSILSATLISLSMPAPSSAKLLPPSEYETVVMLTTGKAWQYGVMASGLSAANNYALLLNSGFKIDESVENKMEGFDKLIILGNETLVSQYIEVRLNVDFIIMGKVGIWPRKIERINGRDIYEYSAALSDIWPEPEEVIVVDVNTFADALVASQLSAVLNAPLLFTDSKNIPKPVLDKIEELKLDVIIIGSTTAVSRNVEDAIRNAGVEVERIGGKDRFETSTLVAERFIEEMKKKRRPVERVIFIDGLNGSWGSVLAIQAYLESSPILFMGTLPPENGQLSQSVKDFLDAHQEIYKAIIRYQTGSTDLQPYLVKTYLKEHGFEVEDLGSSVTDTLNLSLECANMTIKALYIPDILGNITYGGGGGGGAAPC